jgi:hypothetical protein
MSRAGFKKISQLGKLFTRFPKEAGVCPDSFAAPSAFRALEGENASDMVVIQSVPDKFYFLLFGAIRQNLRKRWNGPAKLLMVRSVNGAVGIGWLAEIKRWSVVAWLWSKPWERAYGAVMDGVAYRSATLLHPLKDLRDWFRSKALWQNLRNQGEAFNLEVDGIEVGDLIVDSYLRFRPSPRFDEKDPFVRRLVWQALRDVRQAQEYFGVAKPRLYLTSYSTYIEHGIAVRVALQHGVPVWSFGNLTRFGKRLSLQDVYHTPDCSHYRSTFEKLDRQAERLDEARAQLELRLGGGIDTATSYMRQSAYAASDASVPEGLNGAVVIFLHDFYDSPHVYPALVFCDFWRWICFTVEVLQRTGVAFYLKPHPNQIALSDAALAELRQKYPDLNWLPSGVSNVQLAKAGIICGVTVYGTVAHELAYLGVPSIGSAQHPHHTFDFCRTAKTKEAYQAFLESPAGLPVAKSEMQRQALAFYYMHNLHGSAEERELCRAFVQFWRACNSGEVTPKGVLESFRYLVELPAFEAYAEQLLN